MTRGEALLAAGAVVLVVAASPLVAGDHGRHCTDGPTRTDVVDLVRVGGRTYTGADAGLSAPLLGAEVLRVRCRLSDAAVRREDALRGGDATVLLSGTPLRQVVGDPDRLAAVVDGRTRVYAPR